MNNAARLSLLAAVLASGACASNRKTGPVSTPPPAPAESRPASTSTPPPPPPAPSPPATPANPDFRDIAKLYRANLSEDFILQRIKEEPGSYALGADQVIELRSGGVSERVIEAMLDSAHRPQRPVPEETVTVNAPGPATTAPPPPPPPAAAISWEGVVRRNSGVALFGHRWSAGTLSFVNGELRWVDARDSSKNLLVPAMSIAEHFVTCLKRRGGNECFEWGIRTTAGAEYRFRDVAWEQGVNAKPLAIHDAIKARFPALVDSSRPVEEK